MRESTEDAWTIRDVLATEEGAAALERMTDFHCQGLLDRMNSDPEPAERLEGLRKDKAARRLRWLRWSALLDVKAHQREASGYGSFHRGTND